MGEFSWNEPLEVRRSQGEKKKKDLKGEESHTFKREEQTAKEGSKEEKPGSREWQYLRQVESWFLMNAVLPCSSAILTHRVKQLRSFQKVRVHEGDVLGCASAPGKQGPTRVQSGTYLTVANPGKQSPHVQLSLDC